MTTVVVHTWARDPGNALVRPDGSVEWRSTKLMPGEDDPAAVATATAIAAGRGEDVVAVTLGSADPSWALARGATRAVVVTDAEAGADEAAVAAVLAAAVRTVDGADVVVIGDDEAHPGVAGALAGQLGWPAVLAASEARLVEGGIEVVRRVGDGVQTLGVVPPVVIGVLAAQAEAHVPGMKEQLAARKRPVQRVAMADLDVPVTVAATVSGSRLPQTQGARLFDGTPQEAAQALVAALRSEGAVR
jgi:electron transfer flavoprotein beta subunit